jgi:hypothetical protein
LVQGLLSVASSSIGAKNGVVMLAGPGTETSDSIPARLSKFESVITAKGTKADGNADLFRWINKTGSSAYEYFEANDVLNREKFETSLNTNIINTKMQMQYFKDLYFQEKLTRELELKSNGVALQELIQVSKEQSEEIKKLQRTYSSKQSFEFHHNMDMKGDKIVTYQDNVKRKRLSL